MEEQLDNKIFDSEGTGMENDLTDPFNPNDISIDKKTVLVETCIKRLIQKSIVLNPDYQRHEVWDDVRKSRLIESLMLKIPIPMFYVSADEKSVYTVVDGLQRLMLPVKQVQLLRLQDRVFFCHMFSAPLCSFTVSAFSRHSRRPG